MALQIAIFTILVLVAVALFLFGASRESMKAGFAFLALSAIFFIISGLFIWTDGIQLTTIEQWVDSATGTTPVYEVLLATPGSPIWVIANLFVFGGLALIVLSLGLTVKQHRQQVYEETAF
jgi:hypothetical protein